MEKLKTFSESFAMISHRIHSTLNDDCRLIAFMRWICFCPYSYIIFLFYPTRALSLKSVDYSSSDYVKEEPIKLSIRGLRRTFYPPNQHVVIDNSPPDKKLKLQWVHGYRGRDTHKNLWVLPSGEMLYYVAAVAIIYDRDEGTQRHYTGHTEDIMTWVMTD